MTEWCETSVDVWRNGRVAPGAAGVVDTDGLVDFDLAGHGFGGGEGDFAERDADIGVELAGDVNFAGVGERSVGGRPSI